VQETGELVSELRDADLRRHPNELIVDLGIAVDDAVAHGDTLMEARNLVSQRRVEVPGLVERLADDRDLPLDRGSEHDVG